LDLKAVERELRLTEMPIYEYRCPKCGTFETMQRITEPSLKRCPTCKSKVERMMSRTSFVLKGSGWYATDYARAGNAKSADDSSDKSTDKPSAESAGNGSSANGAATAPSSDGGSSSGSSAKGGSDKSPARKTNSASSEKSSSSSSQKSTSAKSSD
jgi:putative FmdB family regulatory protein